MNLHKPKKNHVLNLLKFLRESLDYDSKRDTWCTQKISLLNEAIEILEESKIE